MHDTSSTIAPTPEHPRPFYTWGQGLTEDDFATLNRSFITREVAIEAGLRRVDEDDGAELVGQQRKGGRKFGGIAIAYHDPSYKHVVEYEVRRDFPDVESSGGKTKEKGKYLGPPGRPNRLYIVPGHNADEYADTSCPVVIGEGAKKGLALESLRRKSGERFLPVSVKGAFSWKTRLYRDDQGRDVKGPIPDLDFITWTDRTAVLLPDSNYGSNDSVTAGWKGLARELKGRGAQVRIAELPRDCGVNGIDDFLGKTEREKSLDVAVKLGVKLISNAKPLKEEKISQANRLIAFGDSIDLFHNKNGECLASIDVNGHIETHPVHTKPFRDYLAGKMYAEERQAPSSQALQDAINALSGRAQFEGAEREVSVRLSSHDGRIYLDLCNSSWQVVEISKQGVTVMEASECPIRFRRRKAMRSLPKPQPIGDVHLLRQFIGDESDGSEACDDSYVLSLFWLVKAFEPDRPFPIADINGPAGSAKSTRTKLLKELVDPSETEHRSCPRDERDLMIHANNSWVCGFDNLSYVSPAMSDALCRLATGGGMATRALYENDEETIFSAKRPIILNGIGEFATRTDLVDRVVKIALKPIPPEKRRTEREFWESFEHCRVSIFSGLLNVVSVALRNIDSVQLDEYPRLADFAEWSNAAEPGLGFVAGTFNAAYKRNREGATATAIESSTLGEVLLEYVQRKDFADGPILLKQLLHDLKAQADVAPDDLRTKAKDFPRTAQNLRNGLQRLIPMLREIGLIATFNGHTRNGSEVSLAYRPEQASPPSQASQISNNGHSARDAYSDTESHRTATVGAGVTPDISNSINGLIATRDACDARDTYLQDISAIANGQGCCARCSLPGRLDSLFLCQACDKETSEDEKEEIAIRLEAVA